MRNVYYTLRGILQDVKAPPIFYPNTDNLHSTNGFRQWRNPIRGDILCVLQTISPRHQENAMTTNEYIGNMSDIKTVKLIALMSGYVGLIIKFK